MNQSATLKAEAYKDFLDNKRHISSNHGIKPVFIPDSLFDYQAFVSGKSILKGRTGVFLDTGLGKTLIEIVIATNYARSLNKRVLIITPLAVAFQFIKEAEKFGIDDIEYSKDGRFTKKIVICNYERLGKFNSNDFECVILDESSILKNFQGAIKSQITSFLLKIKYRFLFTATPSPNDFIELGTSSEALGYMGYTDMLGKFFTNNEDTVSPMNIGTEWILKGHAEDPFFDWVSSWSISARRPSDLGFSDERHILPELNVVDHAVMNQTTQISDGQILLFNAIARHQAEVRNENKETIQQRCERAVDLANSHEETVYWCNLNPEGDLLEKLDKDAYQISGSMSLEKKEELLLAFSNGEIKKLITKPKITAFGLNWQHCAHTVFFPTWSYEQYYQALRRFYRFGQKRNVTADRVYSDGQQRVIDSLIAKAGKADKLFSKLNRSINKSSEVITNPFTQSVQFPSFISA